MDSRENKAAGCSGCLLVLLVALLVYGAAFYGLWCLIAWVLG